MPWKKADQLKKYAVRAAFTFACCVVWTSACLAQEPPLGVALAGRLPSASNGCDQFVNSGLSGTAVGPAGNVNIAAGASPSAANAASASSNNFGGNVPLYGTDLNGNAPLYSTPNLGGNFPLYSSPTPGINAPLYSDPSFYNPNSSNNGSTNNLTPALNNAPLRCRSGIPVGEWLLYPSIRAYSLYSDNLFLTPTSPIKAAGFGTTPSMTAQWTDGIHTTTIFGNIDTQYYPTDTTINTLDREVTVTQKYSPLPDLTFTGAGDYRHKTIQSGLTNAIPTSVNTPPPTSTLLPDGNIELPNGNIVSPNGQIVGNVNSALAFSGTTFVNPYDQYTGTGSVSKIFNGAILTLSTSVASTNYQQIQGTGSTAFTSFNTETFSEAGSVALGPLFYAYSNGDFSQRQENASLDADSDAYRVIGGIGTRQFGLFQTSGYYGYQGSQAEGSGPAGGTVYGAKFSYYPTFLWSIIARFDQTNNISSSTVVSTQALPLQTNVPVQIPLSSSTRISTPSLQTIYQLTQKWTLSGDFSYSHIAYVQSPALTQALFASLSVSYEIWRNMTLSGQYQYTEVISNVAGQSAQRNYVMLSAEYRF